MLDDFISASAFAPQWGEAVVRSGCVGQIITVAGVGGGVGGTAPVVNAAASLAQDNRNSPVIIDLDLTLGDADVWLTLFPKYTIRDVADNIGRLDYGRRNDRSHGMIVAFTCCRDLWNWKPVSTLSQTICGEFLHF